MALKTISLKLDQEEYEKAEENLSKFGDPDINVAYVLRAYIRDLNRPYRSWRLRMGPEKLPRTGRLVAADSRRHY